MVDALAGDGSPLDGDYQRIRNEATLLAGRRIDLAQRASVYHHLYEDSGGGNVFPLIAAHGALWGNNYLAIGMKVARFLGAQYLYSPQRCRDKHQQLEALADAFREINRRVCVEAYTAYHFSKLHGRHVDAPLYLQADLLALLNDCHLAREQAMPMPVEQRRVLFEAFFRWEQAVIVGPAAEDAVAALHWPLAKYLAMRPRIEFAYFTHARDMKFKQFSLTSERIEKGMLAYEKAEALGLDKVEAALNKYGVLPPAFFNSPARYFNTLKTAATKVLAVS